VVDQQVKNTNDNLFAIIMNEYRDKIYGLAGRFFKERVDRKDIVQETFLRVYASLNRLDNNKSVSAWIFRIGTNICIDTLRKRGMRQFASFTQYGETDPCELMDRIPSKEIPPEEKLIKDELRKKIGIVMKDLPAKWRPFIYQFYILDMSLEQVSIANNMSVNTIKTRLYRARGYLRRRLHKEYCEYSGNRNRIEAWITN